MRYIFLLILIFFSYQVNAGIVVENWKENAHLTDMGKNSDILIKARVKDLPSRQVILSFSISFDEKEDVKINRVISDNNLSQSSKDAKFSFVNNILTVYFPEGKKNGEVISIYFSYEVKYDKINKFLRQEEIYIPDFAVGADSTVIFNFPGSFESATFNPNITKVDNSFVYKGVVLQSGVREIIKLTPAQNIWNVTLKSNVSANRPLGSLMIRVPIFFQSTNQKIEDYNVTASIPVVESKNNRSYTMMSFDTQQKNLLVKSSAKVTTGANVRRFSSRNPLNYLEVSDEDAKLLLPILQQIKGDPRYGNIPLYVKIGQFTHDFIKYEDSYAGKLPQISEIVQNRAGVCTEYSRLFEGLARLAGIPAIAIDGTACGEYNKCQGHSWNMVYYNNKWIEVDPTWDLMSGIVSSSHVYTNDHDKGSFRIDYSKTNEADTIDQSVDIEMSLVK